MYCDIKTLALLFDWHKKLGIHPVPLDGKIPIGGKQWGHLTYVPADFYDRNWGWLMGWDGLADLDMDTDRWDDIEIALDIFSEISPVIIERGGMPRHQFFKVTGRPDWHKDIPRELAKLPYKTLDGKEAAWDLRMGSESSQLQSLAIGIHPSGERLRFWKDTRPDPSQVFPEVDWSELSEMFSELCKRTGASVVRDRDGQGINSRPLSVDRTGRKYSTQGSVSMSSLITYITGLPAGIGNQQPCPICWDMPASDADKGRQDFKGHRVFAFSIWQDDMTGRCYHDSCPSHLIANAKSTISVFHVIAYYEDVTLEKNYKYCLNKAKMLAAGKTELNLNRRT